MSFNSESVQWSRLCAAHSRSKPVLCFLSELQHNKSLCWAQVFQMKYYFSIDISAWQEMCLYLLEKQKDAPCKKFNLFVYVKCHLSLPHICSQSSNREELITLFFHESKVHLLSWPLRLNFSNAAHSWPDKWVSKGTAKKKLPLQINFICLAASWYLSKGVLNSHTGCTVCFKSVRAVFYEYTQGFNLPLSDSPGDKNCKYHAGDNFQHTENVD